MLARLTIQRYKSLYDVSLDLEPLTVFIGPNGSGKSNICEAIVALSQAQSQQLTNSPQKATQNVSCRKVSLNRQSIAQIFQASHPNDQKPEDKFWRGISKGTIDFELVGEFEKANVYNFVPNAIAQLSTKEIQASGEGIANSLARILFDNRDLFIELEKRFIKLVPNISRISLDQDANRLNLLRLVDRHSRYEIPSSEISDGTLRLLAFFAALYDKDSPDIICFEEPENGVHPWLLNKIMELLNLVSQEGIRGKPTQILVTTHSPILLNYVEPEQIRAVELNKEGKTQVKPLPTDSVRFQKAMEAYDGELGELWFTNLFGGNPV